MIVGAKSLILRSYGAPAYAGQKSGFAPFQFQKDGVDEITPRNHNARYAIRGTVDV